MENIWGIKVSRISLPKEKLSFNDWVIALNVSSNYRSNTNNNAHFLNSQYNFSLIKNKQNDTTNAGA
jgi:hypothetical protein